MTRSSEDVPAGTERKDTHSAERGSADLSSFDRAISDLQGRIADLRTSVDDLGQPGAAAPAAPAPPASSVPPPEPVQPEYAPPPAPEPPPYEPAQPSVYDPSPQPEYAPPAQEPPPAAYEPLPAAPYEPPPQAYEPPPAPAYEPLPPAVPEEPGSPPPEVFLDSPAPDPVMPAEGSDVLGTFSRVDVGPFEDLLAMTAFEEQLSALPSMSDVRVRRFGAGRAEIELETVGIVPVAREVMRVAPDARPMLQPDGSLIVELTDQRWTGAREQEAGTDEAAEEAAEPGDARA
jgi:hypothetical protein